jgi:hypothetical protein
MGELITRTRALLMLKVGLYEKALEELKKIRRCKDEFIPEVLIKISSQLIINDIRDKETMRMVEAILKLSESLEEEENRLKVGSVLLSRVSPFNEQLSGKYKELFLRCLLFPGPKEKKYQLDVLKAVGQELAKKGDTGGVFRIIKEIESTDFEKYRYRGDINELMIKMLQYPPLQSSREEYVKIAVKAFELGKEFSLPDDLSEVLVEIVKGMLKLELMEQAVSFINEIFKLYSREGIHSVRIDRLKEIIAITNRRGYHDLKFQLYRQMQETARNQKPDPDEKTKSDCFSAICRIAADNGDFDYAIEMASAIADGILQASSLLKITASIQKQVNEADIIEDFYYRIHKEMIKSVRQHTYSDVHFEDMIKITLLFLQKAQTIGCTEKFLQSMLDHSIEKIFLIGRLTSWGVEMYPIRDICRIFCRLGKKAEIEDILKKLLQDTKEFKHPAAHARAFFLIASCMLECGLNKQGLNIFRRAIKAVPMIDDSTDLDDILRHLISAPSNLETREKLKHPIKKLALISQKKKFRNPIGMTYTVSLIVANLARFNLFEEALTLVNLIRKVVTDKNDLQHPLKELITYYTESADIEESLPVFNGILRNINAIPMDLSRGTLLPGLSKVLSRISDKRTLSYCFHQLLASARQLQTANYYVDAITQFIEELKKSPTLTDAEDFIEAARWKIFDGKRKRPLYLMEFDLIDTFKTPLPIARELCKSAEFTHSSSFQRTQHVLVFLIHHLKYGNLSMCKSIISQCPQLGLDILEFPNDSPGLHVQNS